MQIVNPGFETGTAEGWTLGPGMLVTSSSKFSGAFSVQCTNNAGEGIERLLSQPYECFPNVVITASCQYKQGSASSGKNKGAVLIQYLNDANVVLSEHIGNVIVSGSNGAWNQSNVTTPPAPATTTKVIIGGWTERSSSKNSHFDAFSWNYTFDRTAALGNPPEGEQYQEGTYVPFSVVVGGTAPPVTSVSYYLDGDLMETVATAPYGTNKDDIPVGDHTVYAVVTFSNGVALTTSTHTFSVTAEPVPPSDTREFAASNAYTFLVGSGLQGLSAAIPSTAVITAVQAIVDYRLDALVRAKDVGADAENSNPNVLFDIVNKGNMEVVLVKDEGSSFRKIGSTMFGELLIDRADYTEVETGISDNKKWTVFQGAEQSMTLGNDESLFGQTPIALAEFLKMGFGFRFIPTLGRKPAYADGGDGCLRMKIDKIRIRVYFNAGSVDYYFASPDKTQVIKGKLVHSYVFSGNLETADASGVLELLPELEVIDGTQEYIGDDWTIHSAYPPTDDNQIGDVDNRPQDDGVGMSYNGLPTQEDVMGNRSRYEMITTNFYGSPDLDSIYGVHGLPRAFCYNGRFFHKIYTQPDPEKDKPRHVAHHHEHLALGFDQGRVDISVVGEPYNFKGEEGASSWAIGDSVTGLLPLSGTILGVFCKKSVWGISGTTVDNFATQVIVPNNGAVEYTITDMGFPVYANAWGIYTLAQAQEYGDYLGTPMSQEVSPWLRPRLVRKATSNKEVVAAWPVRAKNQYRLVFSDGYVLSMTLNAGQQSQPTFSYQKYDIPLTGKYLIPAAISSQLDNTGEERIHVAPITTVVRKVYEGGTTPDNKDIVVWSATGQGLTYYITIDPDVLRNSEVQGNPSVVELLGWYVNTGEQELPDGFSYEGDNYSIDMSKFEYVERSEPFPLELQDVYDDSVGGYRLMYTNYTTPGPDAFPELEDQMFHVMELNVAGEHMLAYVLIQRPA